MIKKKLFGETEREEVYLYELTNANGMSVKVTEYGCAIVSIAVPDKNGDLADVVLGFDTLEEYVHQKYYFGTVVGRCANRIKNASFMLNGEQCKLSENRQGYHLHGGFIGFHDVVWKVKEHTEYSIRFHYLSTDGEEGYPGNLAVDVEYVLSEDNCLLLNYYAYTDKDTIINMTNHSYFNLVGDASDTIENHELQVLSQHFLEVDNDCIPTGNVLSVENTPFDLNIPRRIGDVINDDDPQMKMGDGLNHFFISDETVKDHNVHLAAVLFEKASGRRLKVYTDKPGELVYTGNYLDGNVTGKSGRVYMKYSGICFETQIHPDAVNHNHFPPVLLKKGDTFSARTVFAFEIDPR